MSGAPPPPSFTCRVPVDCRQAIMRLRRSSMGSQPARATSGSTSRSSVPPSGCRSCTSVPLEMEFSGGAMKRTWLRPVVVALALALAAPAAYAQGGQGTGGTQPKGQDTKAQSTPKASGSADQVFVKEMFITNMAEIELG